MTSATDHGLAPPPPVTAPATMVVDTGGLEALVVEVAAEEYYALRHRVPHRADLRPRSGAHSDRLGGQGGPRRPARRRPRPPGGRLRRPRRRGGARRVPGPRRPHGGLRHCPRHRVRHADRRRFPRHVDPLAVPARRADARRLHCPRRTGSRTGWSGRSRRARSPTPSATSPTSWSSASVLTERLRALRPPRVGAQ